MTISSISPASLKISAALLGASAILAGSATAFAATYDMNSTANSGMNSGDSSEASAMTDAAINSDTNDQTSIAGSEYMESGVSDGSSLQKILRTFGKPGWRNASTYDNMSLETSAFDFTAFRAHRCYDPRGLINERACQRLFGTYAPLKNAVTNSDLQAAITAEFGSSIATLWNSFRGEVTGTASIATPAYGGGVIPAKLTDSEIRARYRTRSHMLWDFCKASNANGRGMSSACFQDNVRLLHSDTPITQDSLGLWQY